MTEKHHLFFVPGMFGFGELAGYDYFGHVERVLATRCERAGVEHRMNVIQAPPTASLRRRAGHVARQIAASVRDDGSYVHIIGHSTGGLDARLVASPSVHLDMPDEELAWRARLRSVVTMNTPHYGTPLAHFFTTVSGTRLLYALSLLTVTTLKVGGLPLTVLSTLVAAAGRVDEALGMDIHLLDHTTDLALRFVGDKGQAEVRSWLEGIREDQGGIVQITPEGMDLFNAAAENAPGVRYGSVVTASPAPRAMRLAASLRSPFQALSATIYSTLYAVTSIPHSHYPYATADADTLVRLKQGLGYMVNDRSNDGIVPTLSMLWGELLWCGSGDHLDVVGHFSDDIRPRIHTDWLACGTHFGRDRFHAMVDSIARFLLS